ncbi:antibiotic biosynthesis monooxygenase [Endozoicomonas gorgoniicola]|uniref:Antibiotic biosynthesis monooxygenase n=1 Tax=Endozoicomonas gorgoniicola TaxID=1234144 RepID=A0ABT3MR82_9GAMM|nr:antibiotic biosynthesis monooxygenase [Endozoicomonas gorgoniicola]MCW7551623.1 antibiotic biosynthesis monooxygenase [Endozoicomonas gorgoniicola]
MRNLAFEKYGCKGFDSCSEGDYEIVISYWESKEQIQAWKNDKKHQIAQRYGQKEWYKSYQVQVVEVLHDYKKEAKGD